MSSRPLVIRATQAQSTVLKDAYAASHSPPAQRIQELSQQTGLPAKWISRWFGRQRTKSRKVGEVIDLTATIREPTAPAQPSAFKFMKIKAEYQETETLPPSTLPRTTLQVPTGPKPAKVTRRKGPLPKKPQAKVAVVQSMPQDTQIPQTTDNTMTNRAGTATHLLVASETQKKSIHSQNISECWADASMASIYSPTGYFSALDAIDAQSAISCSVSNNDSSDPLSTEDVSSYDRSLDLESQRPSSPASSDVRGPTAAYVQPLVNSPCGPSLLPAESLSGQPAPWNLTSQALALHTTLYNHNPAAYHAMLANYAALLPALLPTLTSITASTGQSVTSGTPVPASMFSSPHPSVGAIAPLGWETQTRNSPKLPPLVVDDDTDDDPNMHDPPSSEKQVQNISWISSSDSFDFSGLYYDYAPLGHLQERLEPFRLPESAYLFGREAVGNHLLDERLAVEEPFQAAMGLVLLSKLGLQW